MFTRGRLDHYALNASSEEAFRELRRRLIAEGANGTEGGLVRFVVEEESHRD